MEECRDEGPRSHMQLTWTCQTRDLGTGAIQIQLIRNGAVVTVLLTAAFSFLAFFWEMTRSWHTDGTTSFKWIAAERPFGINND